VTRYIRLCRRADLRLLPLSYSPMQNDKRKSTGRHIHLIGIKGVGMTALAQVLKARGNRVSGSDVRDTFFTDAVLQRAHIPVRAFSAHNISRGVDLAVYSTAYSEKHPERRAVKKLGIPSKSYPEMLGELLGEGKGIAVAGSHGKTTTTAMLGYVLAQARLDPTVIVGSNVPQFKGNARIGAPHLTIIEADEYQNKFQFYHPFGIVLTNVDYDHPDYFPNKRAYEVVFKEFVKKIPQDGFLITNADDAPSRRIVHLAKSRTITFGIAMPAHVQARKVQTARGGSECEVWCEGKWIGSLHLRLSGAHHIANALAVLAAARQLGVPYAAAIKTLARFSGTERRFQKKGVYRGALMYDDYAHHPTEIAATLHAARAQFPQRRVVCVFHPHTFSRTQALFKGFVKSLAIADAAWVMDIYGSARELHGSVHAQDIVEHLRKRKCNAVYVGSVATATAYAKTHLQKNDLLITMGAGDVWKVGAALIKKNIFLK